MTASLPDYLLEAIEAHSRRMNHFYLAVEHLFLALLTVKDSLLAEVLGELRYSPAYVAYRIEQALGQSPDRRYWEGFRTTPRYQKILDIASQHTSRLDQTTLLLAILDENDNVPIRVMTKLGIPLADLRALIDTYTPTQAPPPVHFDTIYPLSQVDQDLLNELLAPDMAILDELDLNGDRILILSNKIGFQLARLNDPQNIMQEAHRVERWLNQQHDKLSLPIRLAVHPKANLALILYQPFSAQSQSPSLDLFNYAQAHGFHLIASILKQDIYASLQTVFWHTPQRFQLQLWREYEFMLPPALVIHAEKLLPEEILHPLEDWSHTDDIKVGTAVELQDFTVQSLHPISQRIILQAGYGDEAVYGASLVEVQQVENITTLSKGRNLPRITGIVTQTRTSLLINYTEQLQPDFDSYALEIQTPFGQISNPLFAMSQLLVYETPASVTLIHGNLRANAILLDDHAHLLHFSDVRQGHALFDWATLECSLLIDCLVPLLPDDSWNTVWEIAETLYHLNQRGKVNKQINPLGDACTTVREIVQPMLDHPQDWREYLAPLSLIYLSYLQNTTAPLGARRLAWVAAAVTAEAFRQANQALEERL